MCGLKWSPDNQYLASGGNDNRLYVWNLHSLSPVQTYTEHLAAVKGIYLSVSVLFVTIVGKTEHGGSRSNASDICSQVIS